MFALAPADLQGLLKLPQEKRLEAFVKGILSETALIIAPSADHLDDRLQKLVRCYVHRPGMREALEELSIIKPDFVAELVRQAALKTTVIRGA